MQIELYFTVMAGMVLAFFLMVGEVVALRKIGMKVYFRLIEMRRSGRRTRFYLETGLVVLFFLVQPFIVGWLVMGALDISYPHFAENMMRQLRMSLSAISGQGVSTP